MLSFIRTTGGGISQSCSDCRYTVPIRQRQCHSIITGLGIRTVDFRSWNYLSGSWLATCLDRSIIQLPLPVQSNLWWREISFITLSDDRNAIGVIAGGWVVSRLCTRTCTLTLEWFSHSRLPDPPIPRPCRSHMLNEPDHRHVIT